MTELASELAAAPPMTGLEVWYRADSPLLAALDGAPVSRWPDESGNGRDLTTALPGQEPTMRRPATDAGFNALEFNGSTSLLKTYETTFTIAQPGTFFVFFKSLTGADLGPLRWFVFDSRNSSVRQVFGRPGDGLMRMYADVDLDRPAVYPMDDYEQWAGVFNGANSRMFRNGSQLGAAGNVGTKALEGLTLGGLTSSPTDATERMPMRIAELLYYSGALDDAEIAAVLTYLTVKYTPVVPPVSVGGLRGVMDAVAGQISDALAPVLAGVQIEPRMIFNPTPPCVDVYPADPFLEQNAFGYAEREAVFVVRARVSTADTDGGQDLLLDLLDPTGDYSMLAALAADATFGGAVQDSAVPDPPSGYVVYETTGGGGALLGSEWRLRVIL